MGDTEKGTKDWMDAIKKALNSNDPPPVSYSTPGGENVTKVLTIIEFNDDGLPPAAPVQL